MFNHELFFKLCDKYGVEVKTGNEKPKIYDDGAIRDIDKYDIIKPYQEYFNYKIENNEFNIKIEDYSSYEWATAC